MSDGALQEISIVGIRVRLVGNCQSMFEIQLGIPDRNSFEYYQALESVGKCQAALLQHCGKGVAHFPRYRAGADQRIAGCQLYNAVSFGFADNDRNQS